MILVQYLLSLVAIALAFFLPPWCRYWSGGYEKPNLTNELSIGKGVIATIAACGAVFACSYFIAPVGDDGRRQYLVVKFLGGLLVAAGGILELVSQVLKDKHSPWCELTHELGLTCLGVGGCMLAVEPLYELVNPKPTPTT